MGEELVHVNRAAQRGVRVGRVRLAGCAALHGRRLPRAVVFVVAAAGRNEAAGEKPDEHKNPLVVPHRPSFFHTPAAGLPQSRAAILFKALAACHVLFLAVTIP
jgi:hypothetical protein